MGFNIDIAADETGEGQVRLTLRGQLTARTAAAAAERLAGVVGDSRNLTLDLGSVTELDGPGLCVLLAVRNHARAGRADLDLVNVSAATLELMEVAGVRRMFRSVRTGSDGPAHLG